MRAANILHLGIKELRSLWRDPILMILILYSFSVSVYSAATALPETLHKAPIAIADEDHSQLSRRIDDAFLPPRFMTPTMITEPEMNSRLDEGLDTFALDIPPKFESDVLANRKTNIQLNIDATRISQAYTGNLYVQYIVISEILAFLQRHRENAAPNVDLDLRVRFNQELNDVWFGGVSELVNAITMLSIILTGAALIREREHGTIEHLLVMPVTPFEIMCSKIWAMGLVVLIATIGSLYLVIQLFLSIPIHGSILLFLLGTVLQLFATTSIGIYLGTLARSMPQFGLIAIMVLLILQTLSGSLTPRESMPQFIQNIMLAAPTTHFIILAQSILFRAAGFSIVWPQFLWLALIGVVMFGLSMARFRKTLELMQV